MDSTMIGITDGEMDDDDDYDGKLTDVKNTFKTHLLKKVFSTEFDRVLANANFSPQKIREHKQKLSKRIHYIGRNMKHYPGVKWDIVGCQKTIFGILEEKLKQFDNYEQNI